VPRIRPPAGRPRPNRPCANRRLRFDADRCRAALAEGFTQATDLAEALVRKGVPFRQAYQLVGTLVRRCQDQGLSLAQVPLELARGVDPRLDAEALSVLDPAGAVARKESEGGTGPAAVERATSRFAQQ